MVKKLNGTLKRAEGIGNHLKAVKQSVITDRFAMYLGDCCKVIQGIPSESVGMSVFSPPFVSLYVFSDDEADMGNCKGAEEFFDHFTFLVKELERVMMPGRIVAVHCMDLPIHKRNTGHVGIYDFPGDVVRCFQSHGFIFHSRHCIWKDPLIAAVRTKAIGLAHKQLCKDSTVSRMGLPDYVLAFRKKGENPKPIDHEYGLTYYPGASPIPRELDRYIGWKDNSTNKRSHWIWQRIASNVWMDIRQTRVLPHFEAKDEDDEKHISPLQADVIERCLMLWSAPDDIVFSPFAGIGSEIYFAVKHERKAIGTELKLSYFNQAVKNLRSLEKKIAKGNLFKE